MIIKNSGLTLKVILSFVLLMTFNSVYAQLKNNLYIERNFDKDVIVASIDTINITAEEFFLSFEFGPSFIRKNKDSRQRHLNFLINEKLLALDGYSRQIDTTEEVSSLITEFRNDLVTEELFKDTILSFVKTDDAEVEEILKKKLTKISLRWLFEKNESDIRSLQKQIVNGASFDSIFLHQETGSLTDDRSLETTAYQLEIKNPILYNLIDSIKIRNISSPVYTGDGWYIIKIDNLEQNMINTESEYLRLRQEAVNAVTKRNMDKLSDQFVNELMIANDPVIKRNAFKIVRSYLGKYYLPGDKYTEWQLEEKLNEEIAAVQTDINDLVLVTLTKNAVDIKDFLTWFRNRSSYIKLNENNFASFSESLEKLIWRMVRDRLLSSLAEERGYYNSEEVQKQISWWKDKITSSAVRNEIFNSVNLIVTEVSGIKKSNPDSQDLQQEFQKKMLQRILALKQEYKIKIYSDELNSIPVSAEYDPNTIEFYSVKNRGLIPRTPYPTINQEWADWE